MKATRRKMERLLRKATSRHAPAIEQLLRSAFYEGARAALHALDEISEIDPGKEYDRAFRELVLFVYAQKSQSEDDIEVRGYAKKWALKEVAYEAARSKLP